MAATAAKTGFGTTFAIESATPGTYTSLGELVDVTPPALTRETVDATNHASPERMREHIGGMRDQSEAAIVLNYDPGNASWDALKAAYDDDASKNYKITFPDGESVIFPALVTELAPATPMADKMTLAAKFKPTGVPTWS